MFIRALLLTSSEVELMETRWTPSHLRQLGQLLLTSSEVELMETTH